MIRRVFWAIIGSPLLWAAAIMWPSFLWGRRLQRTDPEVFLGAAPLVARNFRHGWEFRFNWATAAAAAVGLVVVIATKREWWWRMSARVVVAATAVTSGVFAVLLALTDGRDGLTHGVKDKTEYLVNLAQAPPAGAFVRGFVQHINNYSVHARGHPPGFILLLKAMAWIGLDGVWPVVALSIIATVSVPVAVLVVVRCAVNDEWMRRAAPLLCVAPYVIWMLTSADAVYSAVGAWGVAVFVVGTRRRSDRSAALFGLTGGLLLGALLFFSYGGATFMFVPLVFAIAAIRTHQPGAWRACIGAVVGLAAVTAGFAVVGFWWFAGASATKHEYWEGTAKFRPWNYFLIANLGAAMFALGPVTVFGLKRLLRHPRRNSAALVVVGGGLLALILSHLSQYSKAEVERIWLPFFPWILLAGGVLMARRNRWVPAIAVFAQAAGAVWLQSFLLSKW